MSSWTAEQSVAMKFRREASIHVASNLAKKTSNTASDRLRYGGHSSLKLVGPPTESNLVTFWKSMQVPQIHIND
jgi:hypothetical protein